MLMGNNLPLIVKIPASPLDEKRGELFFKML